MSSCFRRRKPANRETEPLLPRHYADNTDLQRQMHQKLHSYQMLRALSHGYMPSTDQLAANLRALLLSDLVNPENPNLSSAGRQLSRDCRLCIRLFIELLQEKNEGDLLQDAIWNLSKAKNSLDVAHVTNRASESRSEADTSAGIFFLQDKYLFFFFFFFFFVL